MCGAPAPLGPDQGRCGGVRSGLLGVARIRAGAWCQIKKGAVRPGADTGPRPGITVMCRMGDERREEEARNRIIKIKLTKTEQFRSIIVNAGDCWARNDKHFDQQRNICSDK